MSFRAMAEVVDHRAGPSHRGKDSSRNWHSSPPDLEALAARVSADFHRTSIGDADEDPIPLANPVNVEGLEWLQLEQSARTVSPRKPSLVALNFDGALSLGKLPVDPSPKKVSESETCSRKANGQEGQTLSQRKTKCRKKVTWGTVEIWCGTGRGQLEEMFPLSTEEDAQQAKREATLERIQSGLDATLAKLKLLRMIREQQGVESFAAALAQLKSGEQGSGRKGAFKQGPQPQASEARQLAERWRVAHCSGALQSTRLSSAVLPMSPSPSPRFSMAR